MTSGVPASNPSRSPRRDVVAALSALYLVGGVVGSVVAVRGDHPGVPLGIDPGLTSVQGVVLGWGSGVSAPWPLLLALLVVGVGRRGPQIAVPLLGLVFLAGALMEPISWDAAGGSHGIGLAVLVWLNVVVPAALIAVGIGSRRSPDVALGR